MKKIGIVFLAAVIIGLFCALSACGEDKKEDNKETAATVRKTSAMQETTVVLETTSEGGTVEQDSEGNKITRDNNGEIIAVEDKNGNRIEITEYITTHQWITDSDSPGSSSIESDGTSSDSGEEGVEDEIPVIIASIPEDNSDMVDLSDI